MNCTSFSFNIVDKFNRALHDKTWPHRNTGGRIGGEYLEIFDFLLSSILENMCNAVKLYFPKSAEGLNFCELCIILSNGIYEKIVIY